MPFAVIPLGAGPWVVAMLKQVTSANSTELIMDATLRSKLAC